MRGSESSPRLRTRRSATSNKERETKRERNVISSEHRERPKEKNVTPLRMLSEQREMLRQLQRGKKLVKRLKRKLKMKELKRKATKSPTQAQRRIDIPRRSLPRIRHRARWSTERRVKHQNSKWYIRPSQPPPKLKCTRKRRVKSPRPTSSMMTKPSSKSPKRRTDNKAMMRIQSSSARLPNRTKDNSVSKKIEPERLPLRSKRDA